MNPYGIKISRNGKNVSSSKTTDMVFDSSYNTFNIVKQGMIEFDIKKDGSFETIKINHDLGYSPVFIVFQEIHQDKNIFGQERISVVPLPYYFVTSGQDPQTWITTDDKDLVIELTHPYDFPVGTIYAKRERLYYMIFNIPLEGA